jgi:hypothetical protein
MALVQVLGSLPLSYFIKEFKPTSACLNDLQSLWQLSAESRH